MIFQDHFKFIKMLLLKRLFSVFWGSRFCIIGFHDKTVYILYYLLGALNMDSKTEQLEELHKIHMTASGICRIRNRLYINYKEVGKTTYIGDCDDIMIHKTGSEYFLIVRVGEEWYEYIEDVDVLDTYLETIERLGLSDGLPQEEYFKSLSTKHLLAWRCWDGMSMVCSVKYHRLDNMLRFTSVYGYEVNQKLLRKILSTREHVPKKNERSRNRKTNK